VRTGRPWTGIALSPRVTVRAQPLAVPLWQQVFRQAAVRIVTGSRSLLEALEVGGPFLYFNGVLGSGSTRRRHRPEKILELLALGRSAGWSEDLLLDLADFSRGRRVVEVVRRAVGADGGWGRFPPAPRPSGFAPGFEDAGGLLVQLARELAGTEAPASELVRRFQRRSHR